MDKKNGEEIIGGSIDGLAYIVKEYDAYQASKKPGDKLPKEYHMTLFPTNKRLVVFQSSSFLARDKYAQLPLSEIDQMTFIQIEREGSNGQKNQVCVAEFIAPDNSRYPSIVFKFDSTVPEDFAQFKTILHGISQLSGVPLDDYTEGADPRLTQLRQNVQRNRAPYPQQAQPYPQMPTRGDMSRSQPMNRQMPNGVPPQYQNAAQGGRMPQNGYQQQQMYYR